MGIHASLPVSFPRQTALGPSRQLHSANLVRAGLWLRRYTTTRLLASRSSPPPPAVSGAPVSVARHSRFFSDFFVMAAVGVVAGRSLRTLGLSSVVQACRRQTVPSARLAVAARRLRVQRLHTAPAATAHADWHPATASSRSLEVAGPAVEARWALGCASASLLAESSRSRTRTLFRSCAAVSSAARLASASNTVGRRRLCPPRRQHRLTGIPRARVATASAASKRKSTPSLPG